MAIPGNFLSATTESIDPNTSGWTAKLNCVIGLGTGGRNGDGLLKLTSAAAGEMQARTYSSYAVTVGVVYEAFADAAGASVPERIGIRWLDASSAELSITWGQTTSTASSGLHRICVAGAAPVGAARAQVLVSATATASAQVNQFENVYLGFPLRFAGNLLSFNAEQIEIDGSAWVAESNGTMSRTAPPWQWAVNSYWSGGSMTTLTVTATGNASALCTERPAATPGVEYLAYAYLQPPTNTSSPWVELRFYNASGTQLQATRSTMAPPTPSGAYRQIASAVAPAGTASASVAYGITGATAAQAVRADGLVLKVRTSTSTGSTPNDNAVLFADAGFEQSVGQWTVPSGVATIGRSTPWAGQALVDAYSLTISSGTATTSTLQSGKYPVTAGQSWQAYASVKRVAGSWNWTHNVAWYDASNILISTSTGTLAAIPSDGNWYFVDENFTAPANAATGQLKITLAAGATSSTLQMDDVRLRQVMPDVFVVTHDDTASATLTLSNLQTTQLMTVYRVLADGSRTIVRGRDGLLDMVAIGDPVFTVEDYEAPLGVPFSYRAEYYHPTTGALAGYATLSPLTIDPGDVNYGWLKDPIRPQVNRRVLIKQAPDWGQPIDQSVNRVRGRQNAVILSGVRQGREGSLLFWTQDDAEREAVRFLLATGSVLLWQSAPGMGEDDVYVSVAASAFPRVSPWAPDPWREWTLPLTEVDRPTGGVAGSGTWTVQDVAVENTTVLSLLDRYRTVLDLELDQRIT